MTRSLFVAATLGSVLITGLPGPLTSQPALSKATPGEGRLSGAVLLQIRLMSSDPVSPRRPKAELSRPSGAGPLEESAPHPVAAAVDATEAGSGEVEPAEIQEGEDPFRAVQAFHEALRSSDSAGAAQLLAEDAVILEGGTLEDREEYLSHHLSADMAFASAVDRLVDSAKVALLGDVAWVASRSRTVGAVRDQPIDTEGVELVVLTRHDGVWKIRAVHWSSRR
jgi:ketosteroid isomerase-like protein